ncbi:MAG: Ig-like domain-containing protein, partial [Gemmatimonadota bacterium]|nr:Ig-like domain-containing protein [Gemmatimonadota bacterium]
MFTGSNQPYHEYAFIIPPGFITPAKTWEWDVTNTVTTFEFEVFVEADVPHPNGFVQMTPERAAITIGGNVTIAASVRDVVNRTGSGTITFSSADEAIATVNPTTGQVTGVGPGTVTITATSSGPEAPGVATITIPEAGFQIRLRYLTAATASQQLAFTNAAARWQSHLTADLSLVAVSSSGFPFCGGIPVNEVVDDLVIQVILGPIDGVGGILGSAGPCALRFSNDLPAWGIMIFDTADLAALEADGRFPAVILHEMGHVLGFGTLWDDGILLVGGGGTGDPRFTGAAAIAEYVALGATGAQCNPPTITDQCVPVEGTGAEGTIDAHWREISCGTCQTTDFFGRELMTGFISPVGTPNPLSIVSIAQFTDLGYPTVVTTGADPYTLNTAAAAIAAGPPLKLVNDVWRGPLYRIEDDGTMTMVRPDRR